MALVKLQGSPASLVEGDESAARADIRRQIGLLELQLGRVLSEAFPFGVTPVAGPGSSGFDRPRMLDLGALERTRDALADRLCESEAHLELQQKSQARKRAILKEMQAAPAKFKWCRISRAEVGEPGCGAWHSRPILGIVGMFMGWWQVKVSSGCP